MKKAYALIAACAFTAIAACGCASKTSAPEERPVPRNTAEVTQKSDDRPNVIEIEIDPGSFIGAFPHAIMNSSQTRRNFRRSPAGEYTVEYVHYPRGEERDETLDYRLTLNEDNTYTFSVVANGVNAEHSGHWYKHRDGNIVLYYDEPIDAPAHNVYISDTIYAETLPGGKLMFYDNCNVIVMSRDAQDNDIQTIPEYPETDVRKIARPFAAAER